MRFKSDRFYGSDKLNTHFHLLAPPYTFTGLQCSFLRREGDVKVGPAESRTSGTTVVGQVRMTNKSNQTSAGQTLAPRGSGVTTDTLLRKQTCLRGWRQQSVCVEPDYV